MTVASPRASARGFDGLPPVHDYTEDLPAALRFIWSQLAQLIRGKTNNTLDITLAVSASSTTVNDERIGNESYINWVGTNELAGGEMGMYLVSQGKQTCVIGHGTSSGSRTFRLVIVG